jgi:Acetyltransferases
MSRLNSFVSFFASSACSLFFALISTKFASSSLKKNQCIYCQINKLIKLVNFALENLNVCKVDVNEQNEQAIGFYKYLGFEIIGRSELDGVGKNYPILHMERRSIS